MSKFIFPMRPKTRLHVDGPFPTGWVWQPKLDEERGLLVGNTLCNRHGYPFLPAKARAFEAAITEARELFGDQTLDLGLVGFRDVEHFAKRRGVVVVYDLPQAEGSYLKRAQRLMSLPEFWVGWSHQPATNRKVFRLPVSLDAEALLNECHGLPGCEGVIGRNPKARYQCGDSADMVKIKFNGAML